jgi:hypothetical protein
MLTSATGFSSCSEFTSPGYFNGSWKVWEKSTASVVKPRKFIFSSIKRSMMKYEALEVKPTHY